ncbi:MAG TPA: TROVE domain-containing protein [Pilimelia sp.]|nr:TROVE domain-containing protein [Pilimelia sp.]
MAKFNTPSTRPATGRGPVVAEPDPNARTHEGAPAYARDARSELFLLAVTNLVGEGTFYESAGDRDSRFQALVRTVAADDPAWILGFVGWLRGEANMRSASLVAAAEAAHTLRIPPSDTRFSAAGERGWARRAVDAALQRADEPGELLAYWTSRYGRTIPKPVKRGIADAVGRLYTERALLKYDTASRGFRFADVIDLVHPSPTAPWQGALFAHALDRRHGRDKPVPEALGMVRRNGELRAAAAEDPGVLLDAESLRAAGMTWEDALSLAGPRLDKARLWEAMIPSMGLMALARNLRNFDEAGVTDAVASRVAARFADPAQVAGSRMFPFRWLSAYEQAPSLRWGHALDQALQASLAGLPSFPGRTLVLVDTSASMTSAAYSARSTVTPLKAGAVFGVALAARGKRVDLHGFADGTFRHAVPAGGSVIREVKRFTDRVGEVGHGTRIAAAVQATYRGHDRVVIVSDMQTMDGAYGRGVSEAVPPAVPVYGFNLGGYRPTVVPGGRPHRVELGGLTDATFRMIPLLERGRDATWPWEEAAQR